VVCGSVSEKTSIFMTQFSELLISRTQKLNFISVIILEDTMTPEGKTDHDE
jgi:hypothetical protein